ncbi:S-adenosyl-L-methionine-dependent methyltransferase [Dunaliella salina]|uniref:S-adenosyl-L-methionine-dependent methyltransferase n=1 Tax=Dunaliella salina TaxID=3046 RepID=A0ABQ7G280_DUNSA|nr:S-adenosyl-L-methionine-dependent methyltransferase [Dunaliella salina]|eukprot:KAF5828709.1 S-adenosyl-L-methionine-dependent methyltransferase [Dunaliella salina]
MRFIPLAGTACFLVVSAGALFIFRGWKRRRYGGLESLVSYSSRIIAALRAVETQKGEGHALIMDPFAEKLAGPQAMAEVLGRRQAGDNNNNKEVAAGIPSINRLVLRTLLVDDFVRLAVRAEMSEQERHRALRCPMLRQLTDWLCGQGAVCKQVVLLGAGMDTRAWRLHFPGGVHWWEVDVAEVLEAKRTIMERAGAMMTESTSVAGRLKRGTHQLRCASYARE